MPIKNYNIELYPFKNRRILIDGNDIHYIDEGKGELILFCHPPVASSFMYRHMITQLSKNFRCIALDFPGFGLSVAASDYVPSIQSQAAILESFIKDLGIYEIYFVMQEVGGHAGISVFMKNPKWLKGIILTDTIIFPVSQYPKIATMLKIVNGSVFNFFNSNFNFLINRLTSSGIKRRKMTNLEKETYKAMFDTKQIRRTSTAMLYQLYQEEKFLSSVQKAFETTFNLLPTLLIYGEEDSLAKLGVPERISGMMRNSQTHFISGEGHFPHEGAPEEMSLLIGEWITKRSHVELPLSTY